MLIKECPNCKGELDYSMSEINLIPNTNPQESEIEGVCPNCESIVFIKFRAYGYKVVKLDELLEAEEKKLIKI